MEREDFELAVAFLASVPLFRQQLPRSELPKLAQSLTRMEWHPGQRLVRQGDMGRVLFLIQAGEALVLREDGRKKGVDQACATLVPGDYFGGHTLTTEQRNVATIVAKGPAPLVTLSMSRVAFQQSGIVGRMHFPKRAAIYELQAPTSGPDVVQACLPETEIAFICAAMKRNVNLRALHHLGDEGILGTIARSAERRKVPAGAVVAQSGDLGQEFFVVREGSVDAVFEAPGAQGQQSAEAAVSHSSMAERLIRKQDFLRKLTNANTDDSPKYRRRSVNVASVLRSDNEGGSEMTAQRSHRASANGTRTSPRPFRPESLVPALTPRDTPPVSPGLKGHPWTSPPQASSTGAIALDAAVEEPAASFPRSASTASGSSFLQRRRSVGQPRQFEGMRVQTDAETDIGCEEEDASDSLMTTFRAGESFGELSLLYNTRREATFRVAEDAVVYVIGRRPFTASFNRRNQHRFREYYKLLEEVRTLTLLSCSERWELACNATGLVDFKPGERVLQQGKIREARQWYIVCSGSGVMTQERTEKGATQTASLATLHRGSHFGERSLLRGDPASQVNVDSGPEGMTCLTLDFEVIRPILEGVFQDLRDSDGFMPDLDCDIEEWCVQKGSTWCRHASADGTPSCKVVLLQDLQRVSVLGRGAYGQVLLVSEPSGKQYALKAVSKGLVQRHNAEQQICWERELLLMVDSPFVIQLHKTFRDSQYVYFLLEAALGGSLLEVLYTCPEVFAEDQPRGSSAAFYVACLIKALEHLHERRIVFRDLKPDNALLDGRGYTKLCDMGFARFVLGKTNTLSGTPDYMAPEMIDFPHAHDQTVDWWALGVLAYELQAGQPPFEDEGISEPMGRLLAIRRSQESGRLEFPFHFPHVSKDFVGSLLQKLPRRLGASGGAAEVRGHKMWSESRFDFAALDAQELTAPVVRPQENGRRPDEDAGTIVQEYLEQRRGDSLYLPFAEGGSEWDKSF